MLLSGHKSALDERSRSLAFIRPLLIALLAFVAAVGFYVDGPDLLEDMSKTEVLAPALAVAASTLVVCLALAERVQIQGWTPTYHEFLLLIEREVKRMRNRGS